MANVAVVWDPRYALHDTDSHPEGPDRVPAIVEHLEQTDLWPRLHEVRPSPASESDLLRVHTPAHVDRIRRAALLRGGEWIDPDTYVSAQSFEVALLAVGGVLEATAQWAQGRVAFAAVRPPGHHATPDRAMGFCLFNNIAIVARRLLSDGLQRIVIVDWDAHHGNGTQAVFLTESDVLYISLHQWPLYPGTGSVDEVGEGPGEGYTVNVPLPPGCDDGALVLAFEAVVVPVIRQYAPQAILVSAGFDAHVRDDLASMAVTEAGFAYMGGRLQALAAECCEGRLALALEGGYDRPALASSVEAVLRAVADESVPQITEATAHAEEAVEKARRVQSAYWDV